MKSQFLLLITFLMFFGFACQNTANQSEQADNIPEQVDMHTSRISLDWAGVYEGTLPCADCEGILTRLVLYDSENYALTSTYLGKEKNRFEESGSFEWVNNDGAVHLKSEDDQGYTFLVGENQLFMLDREGNRITGELADLYILRKKEVPSELEGVHWKLIELNGKAIIPDGDFKEAFIFFNAEDNNVHGNSGCNGFSGTYEHPEQFRLRFGNIAATLMACPEMEVEKELFELFEIVDNYSIGYGRLSLNKARMAPLAIFEAVDAE